MVTLVVWRSEVLVAATRRRPPCNRALGALESTVYGKADSGYQARVDRMARQIRRQSLAALKALYPEGRGKEMRLFEGTGELAGLHTIERIANSLCSKMSRLAACMVGHAYRANR